MRKKKIREKQQDEKNGCNRKKYAYRNCVVVQEGGVGRGGKN